MCCSNTPIVFGFVIISAGHVFVHLRFQRREVDHALRVRLQVLDRVARHRRRRRIRSVRRIRNQNLLRADCPCDSRARAHQQDARQFAVRARRRLQRDRVHAA